ncbi:MAG: alpha/beta hydrolase [Clostridia bacterium]|nr:alpha/beta hydrolase [Clostridia bacterium]
MPIAVIILIVLAVLLLALGFTLASYSLRIRRQTLPQARQWQESRYDLGWYDAASKEDYTVKAKDGYVLHAQLIKNPIDAGRYVIISHGYTDNRFGALKYAGMYLKLGFHVVVYDLRGHGENAESLCTYSVRERQDLYQLINDTRTRHPGLKALGIHGESLGAATSIACLEFHPEIDFVVADCGFSEIRSVMAAGLKNMRLPVFLLPLASLCAKLRCGYSYGQMRPIDSLTRNKVPVLFMHGADDDFIPPLHSQRMRETTQGFSEIHLIPDAGHAVSIFTAPEAYREYVVSFLKQCGVDVAE